MSDSEPSSPGNATMEDGTRPLPDELRQLAEDARTLAKAEIAYQKSRAAFAGQEVKRVAVLGILAAVLVFFALMALTLGLVIALAPLLTAWGAMAAVFAGLLVLAGLCLAAASARWKRMKATLADEAAE